MVSVTNLDTGGTQVYSLNSRDAVIAAYGRSQRDGNTWTYASKYGPMVRYGRSGKTVSCGQFCAMLGQDDRDADA